MSGFSQEEVWPPVTVPKEARARDGIIRERRTFGGRC